MMAAAFILKKTKQSAIQKDLREWPPTIASRLTSLVFVSKVSCRDHILDEFTKSLFDRCSRSFSDSKMGKRTEAITDLS